MGKALLFAKEYKKRATRKPCNRQSPSHKGYDSRKLSLLKTKKETTGPLEIAYGDPTRLYYLKKKHNAYLKDLRSLKRAFYNDLYNDKIPPEDMEQYISRHKNLITDMNSVLRQIRKEGSATPWEAREGFKL